MKHKKLKYNIIFLFMVCLVLTSVCVSIFVPPVDITQGGGGETPILPDDPDNPDEPSGGDDPSGGEDNPPIVDPDEEEVNVPSIKYPLKVIAFALERMYEGKGYDSTIDYTMINNTNVMGASVVVTQRMIGKLTKSGNTSLEEMYFNASGSFSNMAANYYRYFYSDGTTVTHGQTNAYTFDSKLENCTNDMSKGEVKNYSMSEYLNKYFMLMAENPNIPMTSKNISASHKTFSVGGVKYYEITAKFTDTNSLPQPYVKYYSATGQLQDIKITECTYTFLINKQTGKIAQLKKNETLVGKNPDFGVNVTSDVSVVQKFTAMDKVIDIVKP